MNFKELQRERKVDKVQPIRNIEDIQQIRAFLVDRPRDLLFFDIVTQSGIEINRLLHLKVKDILGLKVGDRIDLKKGIDGWEGIIITKTIYKTWKQYLKKLNPDGDDYLFKSRNINKPLNITSISNMVTSWFKSIDLKGLTSTRSLRKTWELHYKDISQKDSDSLRKNDSLQDIGPIKTPKTIQEMAYDKLFRAIISGKINPGERLIIDRLARNMNISHIPLREALVRLETARFVQYKKKRTYVVNDLSLQDIKQIYEIRNNLEIMAVKKAALNCTEETINHLEFIHQQYVEAKKINDVDMYLKFNRQFHYTIYRNANSHILQEIISGLWYRTSPYLYILCRGLDNYPSLETINYHKKMLDGMKLRDPAMVAKWLRTDITKAMKLLTKFFQKRL